VSSWLESLRLALQRTSEPVTFFFRDDDVGWGDARLYPLLDVFARREVPIDIAVIPQALSRGLAVALGKRAEQAPQQLGLHQHGFSHCNHESTGRKCEFGDGRTREQQFPDLETGKRKLRNLLGNRVDPIFTPPWNRCSQLTVDSLARLGFAILSRDITASPLHLRNLVEVPVTIDWFRRRKGVRMTRDELGVLIAMQVQQSRPVIGIMLHHADMDATQRLALGELLELLSVCDSVSCRRIRDVAGLDKKSSDMAKWEA